ncbi:MAG: hypothetical protein F6K14_20350 [Symploca sp. SIO2C1]|nr:hypothetical protein [Symploca sp. SIO2C1]
MKQFWLKQPVEIKNAILAVALVTAVVLYLYFFKFEGNITGFFRIGSILPLSPFLQHQDIFIYQGELGYDGQMFLSLALDPFLQESGTIDALDHPQYRYRRILYPLLGYIFGFGNSQLIPYIMVGINCLSIVLIVFVSSLYLKKYSGITWQGLLVLCIPGVWIILSLSTAGLLSSLLLVTALYCYRNNQPLATALSIAAACLNREIMLLMWLSLLLTSIWERKWSQLRHLLWAWLPAAIWNIYVVYRLQFQGTSGVSENFGYPLVGIFNKLAFLVTDGSPAKNIFEAYSFSFLLVICVSIFLIYRERYQNNKVIIIATIFYGMLLLMSSFNILNYYLNYSRVYINLYFLLLLAATYRHVLGKTILFIGAGLASITFLLAHS